MDNSQRLECLIVDDHPAICFALKAMLEKIPGFTVSSAADGVRAMALVKQKKPALVILDIMLARLDGLEVLARIKQFDPAIKVVILTGLSAEHYAMRTLRGGAEAFLGKNIDLHDIPLICRQILQGYSYYPDFCLKQRSIELAMQPVATPVSALSDRELSVLRYLLAGKSIKEIAVLLVLSNKTISTYKARIFEKTGTNDLDHLKTMMEPQ